MRSFNLSQAECGELLAALQTMNLNDERPLRGMYEQFDYGHDLST